MNPLEIAIALARKIIEKLNEASTAGAAVEGSEYRVMETHLLLQQAVEDAFERDRKHMWTWLGPVSLITPGLLGAAFAAEAAGRTVRDASRSLLKEQAAALTAAEESASRAVPRLMASGEQWRRISEGFVTELPQAIAALEQVEGWQGNASSGYGSMARSQNDAAERLNTGTQPLPGALETVGGLNETIVNGVRIETARMRQCVDAVRPSIPGVFQCSLNAWRQVAQLQITIDQQLGLETTRAAIGKLEDTVSEAEMSLEDPWPSA